MSAIQTATPKVGQVYVIDPAFAGKYAGVRYEIVAVKKVNATGHPVDAAGGRIPGARRLNARFAMWLPAGQDTSTVPSSAASVTTEPYLPPLAVGSFVVKADHPAAGGWKVPADRIFVVLQDRGDKVKLVEAGGSPTGRYWPSVPRAYVTQVRVDLTLAL